MEFIAMRIGITDVTQNNYYRHGHKGHLAFLKSTWKLQK